MINIGLQLHWECHAFFLHGQPNVLFCDTIALTLGARADRRVRHKTTWHMTNTETTPWTMTMATALYCISIKVGAYGKICKRSLTAA